MPPSKGNNKDDAKAVRLLQAIRAAEEASDVKKEIKACIVLADYYLTEDEWEKAIPFYIKAIALGFVRHPVVFNLHAF